MKKQDWKRNKSFREGVKNASKAKKLRKKVDVYDNRESMEFMYENDGLHGIASLRKFLVHLYRKAETLESQAREQLQKARQDRYEYLKFVYCKDIECLRKLKEKRVVLVKQEKEYIRRECEKLGHIYVTTSREILSETGEFTYLGQIFRTQNNIECLVCGNKEIEVLEEELAIKKIWIMGKDIAKLPEKHQKMLKGAHAQYTKKIDTEIAALEQKLEPLQELCQLFGHDAYQVDAFKEIYQCKCCMKVMSKEELLLDYDKVEYKSIVPQAVKRRYVRSETIL